MTSIVNTVIKVENLSKQYRLGTIGTGTLSHDLNRWWHRVRGKEDPYLKIGQVNDRTQKGGGDDYVWALQDINFEVKQGEVLGIIGRNGAGKSTLLKILSRTTLPTTGSVKVKGRIASLLEVGTGFHPELTGRENIFLNGAILGMRKTEIKRKFDEIVDFAGVEKYVDTPVKRYSSGMYVRLAFAVAAYLEPEILIVDEVLAVGDAEFQKKCLGKMKDVSVNEGRTVLFVSHNMGAISQLCTSGVLLTNGTVSLVGGVSTVINAYLSMNQNLNSYYVNNSADIDKRGLVLREIYLLNLEKKKTSSFKTSDNIVVSILIGAKETLHNSSIFLTVLDSEKRRVFSAEKELIPHENEYQLIIEDSFLSKGQYSLQVFIHIPGIKRYDELEDVCAFEVVDDGSQFIKYGDYNHGSVLGRYTWK